MQSAGRIRRGLCVQAPRLLLLRLADLQHAVVAGLGAEILPGGVILADAGLEGNWAEVAFGDEGLDHGEEGGCHGAIGVEECMGRPRTSWKKRATPPRASSVGRYTFRYKRSTDSTSRVT